MSKGIIRNRTMWAVCIGVVLMATVLLTGCPTPPETPPPYLLQWGDLGAGNGQFAGPHGVAVDTAGNVYVADAFDDGPNLPFLDFGNHRIQKFGKSPDPNQEKSLNPNSSGKPAPAPTSAATPAPTRVPNTPEPTPAPIGTRILVQSTETPAGVPVTLEATLTRTSDGAGLSGKALVFSATPAGAGGAITGTPNIIGSGTTGNDGKASIWDDTDVTHLQVFDRWGNLIYITVSFAGDADYAASSGTGTLTVTPGTGTIVVNTNLDGVAWQGEVSFTLTGPSPFSGSYVPQTFTGHPAGTYTIGSITVPAGMTLHDITQTATQTLAANGTITFTLNVW